MKEIDGGFLLEMVLAAHPVEAANADIEMLRMQIHKCESILMHWAGDNAFWSGLATDDFSPQLMPTVTRLMNDDKVLAAMALSALPPTVDFSKRVHKAVQAARRSTTDYLHIEADHMGNFDPSLPIAMLRSLFQIASGGLVIAAASNDKDLSLGAASTAVTSGSAGITEASKDMRKYLDGKVKPYDCCS
jgi:hypothetical protein